MHVVAGLVLLIAVEETVKVLGLGAEEFGVDRPLLLVATDDDGDDAVGEPAGERN